MELAKFVRKKRLDKALTLISVSDDLGISNATFCKFESGKIILPKKYLKKLAKIVDTPESELQSMRLADEIQKRHEGDPAYKSAIKILNQDGHE
jgi:transcriptional regulator with XRE-family HTH domain